MAEVHASPTGRGMWPPEVTMKYMPHHKRITDELQHNH